MATRGRPPSNGNQPGWILLRATLILNAFYEARHNGAKYDDALQSAVDTVKADFPGMCISLSTVRRVLRDFWPEDGDEAMIATKITPSEDSAFIEKLKRPLSQTKVVYTLGFKPRPEFSRVNKAKRPK